MRLWLSKSSEVPIRVQLEAQIILGILGNDLKVGQRLPSTRELARRYKIHSNNKSFVMASGLYGHSAVLVDVSSGTMIADIPIVAKRGFDIISDYLKYSEKLSFHPSSRFFMGANQNLVRFWDTKSGKQITVITDGRDPAAFSGNGKFLVTTDKDKKSLSLWEVETHIAFAQAIAQTAAN